MGNEDKPDFGQTDKDFIDVPRALFLLQPGEIPWLVQDILLPGQVLGKLECRQGPALGYPIHEGGRRRRHP